MTGSVLTASLPLRVSGPLFCSRRSSSPPDTSALESCCRCRLRLSSLLLRSAVTLPLESSLRMITALSTSATPDRRHICAALGSAPVMFSKSMAVIYKFSQVHHLHNPYDGNSLNLINFCAVAVVLKRKERLKS
ncbi:hypothetical protein PIB30_030744 [Stylosanthes scabra]|uniref:Uncharacterized protein n=1 Tax=Stylosanthes scabra TaxID=79078 RepID=A0ABU6WBW3_9FABA|nr:hypothetical protein [Stylosanthes scabra]